MNINEVFPGHLPFNPIPFEMPQPKKWAKRRERVRASNPPFKAWRKAHRAKIAARQP